MIVVDGLSSKLSMLSPKCAQLYIVKKEVCHIHCGSDCTHRYSMVWYVFKY